MGKKKFEKNKGVTFKLVFRSEDEQANSNQTLSDRIFSVIEADKKKADKSNDKERQKILSQFTKEDLGQAPVKKPSTKSLAGNATAPPRNAASSQSKGRDDLWITHLTRMKEQAKAEAEAEEAEEEERLAKKAAAKKAPAKKEDEEDEEWEDDDEEEEEWEDEDEEEEEEEYEEIEEEEEEEEQQEQKQEQEEKQLFKKKPEPEEQVEGKKNILENVEDSKKIVIKEEDFPALGTEDPSVNHDEYVPVTHKTQEEKLEELAEEEIDLKKVHVKGAVRMKRYDDLGLPMDGYNYYQHIVDPNSGGVPSFSFNAQYDQQQYLPEDIDIKKEKMNPEEREVYEALEYEGEAQVYEAIEDDFFEMLTKKEEVVVEEGEAPAKDGKKKVTFGENEIKEILTTKDEANKASNPAKGGKDPILSRKDFQKVLKQHVETLKDKYKEERIKNRIKYGMAAESSEEEEEEEEEVEDADWSEDEESRPKGFIEKLKWNEDVAAQECVAKSMSDLDSDFEDEYRRTKADKQLQQASTRAASERALPVRQAKLNIVKEDNNNKKTRKPKDEKSTEEKEESGDEEKEEEEEGEGEEEKNKVEEVFKKREKGETKEEKKQRKAAIKQFKQERKEKKKKFKENFDSKKKEQISVAHRQTSNLQGLSIYKLTV